MARVPVSFVNETLWPEFQELNKTLGSYLDEETDRVITKQIGTIKPKTRRGREVGFLQETRLLGVSLLVFMLTVPKLKLDRNFSPIEILD